MKWQSVLSKAQLKHLRWARDGATPSLQSFRELRVYQKEQDRIRAEDCGLLSPSCHECNMIEARLKEIGKL